jgi:hypothetical protein
MKISQSDIVKSEVVDHKMMDHSQHQLLVMSDHNEIDKNVDNCCADNCLCDMANCNGNSLINNLNTNYSQYNLLQTKTVFLEKHPQTQYLNYLFKPPIQSLS